MKSSEQNESKNFRETEMKSMNQLKYYITATLKYQDLMIEKRGDYLECNLYGKIENGGRKTKFAACFSCSMMMSLKSFQFRGVLEIEGQEESGMVANIMKLARKGIDLTKAKLN